MPRHPLPLMEIDFSSKKPSRGRRENASARAALAVGRRWELVHRNGNTPAIRTEKRS